MRLETERALRVDDPGLPTELPTGFVDKNNPLILQVALDTPLRRTFDYVAPVNCNHPTADGPAGLAPDSLATLPPGVRLRVPFGRRHLIGILVGTSRNSSVPRAKLKSAMEIVDNRAVFDPVTFDLLCWAADYYHHPTGEVIAAALPACLPSG